MLTGILLVVHSTVGAVLVLNTSCNSDRDEHNELKTTLEVPLGMKEIWTGLGYPVGLLGSAVPLCALPAPCAPPASSELLWESAHAVHVPSPIPSTISPFPVTFLVEEPLFDYSHFWHSNSDCVKFYTIASLRVIENPFQALSAIANHELKALVASTNEMITEIFEHD